MRRFFGLGLVVAAISGLVGCGSSSIAPTTTRVAPASAPATAKAAKPESGTATGWVGQKNLYLSLFASAFGNGRYGDQDVRLDMMFGDRVRGNVGETPVELNSFNGQLHGYVGKYPVWATYYNGHIQAYNGATALNLNEYSSGLGGWVGMNSCNVSWFGKLESVEKMAVFAVIFTEMVPPQKN